MRRVSPSAPNAGQAMQQARSSGPCGAWDDPTRETSESKGRGRGAYVPKGVRARRGLNHRANEQTRSITADARQPGALTTTEACSISSGGGARSRRSRRWMPEPTAACCGPGSGWIEGRRRAPEAGARRCACTGYRRRSGRGSRARRARRVRTIDGRAAGRSTPRAPARTLLAYSAPQLGCAAAGPGACRAAGTASIFRGARGGPASKSAVAAARTLAAAPGSPSLTAKRVALERAANAISHAFPETRGAGRGRLPGHRHLRATWPRPCAPWRARSATAAWSFGPRRSRSASSLQKRLHRAQGHRPVDRALTWRCARSSTPDAFPESRPGAVPGRRRARNRR
jgi:hypothetical protein